METTDTLQSLVAGLGDPSRDKFAMTGYVQNYLADDQLLAAFKSSSLAKRIIRMPVLDSIREGRIWQADSKQIEKIEAEEKRLGFWQKLKEVQIKARLWGGAAIFIGTGEKDLEEPLNLDAIGAGGVKYLTVLSRREIVAGETDNDPLSETYNKPAWYEVPGSADMIKIHPSRFAIFIGAEHAEPAIEMGVNAGWGDSILEAVYIEIKQSDSSAANIASLIFEANVDVFGVPDLMSSLSDPDYEQRLLKRFMLSAAGKSINKALIRDKAEEYDRKQISFANLPQVLQEFMILCSGAAEIPATFLFGRSPAGMNSTGESDERRYYDRLSVEQKLTISPAIYNLDESLIRSALGSRPEEVHYSWAPLWQLSEKEQSEIAKNNSETAKTYLESGIFDAEEMREVCANQLIESGFYPGLEAAMKAKKEDWSKELGGEDQVTDAEPRTLYVRRNVLNADEIIKWAKEQGFKTTLSAEDMHVTIAFSRNPVDWMAIGEAWQSELKIAEGGPRLMEQFGEARVLLFSSNELKWRHEGMIANGASWDHPEYQPHITISYDPNAPDISQVQPYQGEIILGPEIFEEVKENWQEGIEET